MKSVAAITLLVLGCSFASAQTLRLVSVDGTKSCNYVLTQLTPYDVWQGYNTCDTSTVVGISGGLTKKGNPAGFGVKGVALASNAADAEQGIFTGVQWFIVTSLTCSSKKYGWVGFAAMNGAIFGDNYGFVSCQRAPDSR